MIDEILKLIIKLLFMFLRKRILNKLLFILYINLIIKNNNNYFCNYLLNEKNLFKLLIYKYKLIILLIYFHKYLYKINKYKFWK